MLLFINLFFFFHNTWAQQTLDPILINTPKKLGPSVTLIQSQDLKNKSPLILESLDHLSGINIFANGGHGQNVSLFIRGAKSEHVLVLVDGIEVNDPSSPARGFDFANLSSDNIERIEIYKGASSAIFGSDALAGVINIITKTGQATQHSVYFEGGSFLTHRSQISTSGSFSKTQYYISGSHYFSDSFSAAQAPTPADKDGFKNLSFNFKLNHTLASQTQLSFTAMFNQYQTDLDYAGSVDDPNYTSEQQQVLLGSSLSSQILPQVLNWNLGVNAAFFDRTYNNPSDTSNTDSYYENFDSVNFKITNQFKYQITSSSHLELNLDFKKEFSKSHQELNGINNDLPQVKQYLLSQNVFYQNKIKSLSIIAGVRHDYLSSLKHSFFNPLLSTEYDLNSIATKVSFNFSMGLKGPSLFQLYSDFGTLDLKPEESLTFDIALEKIFNNKTHASLIYHNTSYSNLIDFDMTTSKYNNISKAHIHGVELNLAQEINSILTTELSYNFLETKDEVTNLDLLRRPTHLIKAALNLEYADWSLQLISQFVGSREDIDPISFARIKKGSYFTINSFLQYNLTSKTTLYGRIYNILDKNYQQIAGYTSSKRALYLGFKANF